MNFGEKIASLRKAGGMTQAELGEKLNITYQAVSKWERGESSPDFATLSKIAKLFGVPITYFEDGEDAEAQAEVSATAVAEDAVAPVAPEETVATPAMLGMCKECGRVLYEGEEYQVKPFIICKECHERVENEKIAEAKRIADSKKEREENEKRIVKRKRNLGLILAAVATVAVIILCAVGFSVGFLMFDALNVAVWAVIACFAFTFTAQVIWGGLIREICSFGFVTLNFPGIIFSLDIDGILFFIGVKLLFGFLSVFLWLFLGLLTSLVAFIISPVVFIPKVIRMSCGKDDSD